MISGTFYTLQEAPVLLRKDRHTVLALDQGRQTARASGGESRAGSENRTCSEPSGAADQARQKVLGGAA